MDGDRRAPAARLAPWLVFALAFGVRSLGFASVFVGDRIVLVSYDAYYRLRRVLYALGDAAVPLEVDPYVQFPFGGKPIMPPYLDLGLAALVRPFAAQEDRALVEAILVWIPPLLGACTALVGFHLARRFLGLRVAFVSGLLLALLPAHVYYCRLSFIDHHVAVSLLTTLLLGGAMELLRRFVAPRPRRRGSSELAAVGVGICAAASLLVWPGSVLHVAIVEAGLLGALAVLRDRERAVRLAGLLALANGAALVVVAPFSLGNEWPQWSAFSSVVLSRFQPWLFASVSVFGAACAWLWRVPATGRGRGARAAGAAAIGVLVLAVGFVAFPELQVGIGDALDWAASADAFQRAVSESRPLFRPGAELSTALAEIRFSRLLYAFPFAVTALVAAHRRRDDAAAYGLLGAWAVVLGLATLLQQRFQDTSSVAFSLVVGWALVALHDRVSLLRGGALRRRLVRVAYAAAVAACLLPSLAAYLPELAAAQRRLAGRPASPSRMDALRALQYDVAEWIRDHTPSTSGLYDASVKPEYSVFAPWGLGHLLKYVGERPTVVDNFGEYVGRERFQRAERVHEMPAEQAYALLAELGARYIVVRRHFSRSPIDRRLHAGDGTGLSHYRLVYESPPRRHFPQPEYKVFEVVPGARVRGRAEPGREVMAAVDFVTRRGRRGTFGARTVADAGGTYRLLLPVATNVVAGAVSFGRGALRASGAGLPLRSAELAVPEARVRTGGTVDGPDLRTPPGATPVPDKKLN